MKKFLLLLIMAAISGMGYAQTGIEKFFTELPDNALFNISKAERAKAIKSKTPEDVFMNCQDNSNLHMHITNIDRKNGYMTFDKDVQCGFGEMCYWNMTNGHKLIGINFVGCNGSVYTCFYKYDGTKYTALNINDVIPTIKKADFFKSEAAQKEFNEVNGGDSYDITFHLPQVGKDITARIGEDDFTQIEEIKTRGGNCIVLKWDDGKFKKTAPIYKED